MKKLVSGLFVVVFVLIVLLALLQIVNADEISTLDWFTVNSYEMESGEVRANFDFYYFEDNSGYIGSMSIAYDCNGNFEIDEMVDITPYATMDEAEILAGMESFGQNINYSWNLDSEYHELAWGNGYPQMWEILQPELNQVENELLNNDCSQPEYTVFLPFITNN